MEIGLGKGKHSLSTFAGFISFSRMHHVVIHNVKVSNCIQTYMGAVGNAEKNITPCHCLQVV